MALSINIRVSAIDSSFLILRGINLTSEKSSTTFARERDRASNFWNEELRLRTYPPIQYPIKHGKKKREFNEYSIRFNECKPMNVYQHLEEMSMNRVRPTGLAFVSALLSRRAWASLSMNSLILRRPAAFRRSIFVRTQTYGISRFTIELNAERTPEKNLWVSIINCDSIRNTPQTL